MTKMEKEEIANRTKAMTKDECRVVIRNLPSDLMCEELERRMQSLKQMVEDTRRAVRV